MVTLNTQSGKKLVIREQYDDLFTFLKIVRDLSLGTIALLIPFVLFALSLIK